MRKGNTRLRVVVKFKEHNDQLIEQNQNNCHFKKEMDVNRVIVGHNNKMVKDDWRTNLRLYLIFFTPISVSKIIANPILFPMSPCLHEML